MPAFWIGVDGGGTRTRAVVAGEDLVPMGRGASGPANASTRPLPLVVETILEAVGDAAVSAVVNVGRAERVGVGLAGVESAGLVPPLTAALEEQFGAGRVFVTTRRAHRARGRVPGRPRRAGHRAHRGDGRDRLRARPGRRGGARRRMGAPPRGRGLGLRDRAPGARGGRARPRRPRPEHGDPDAPLRVRARHPHAGGAAREGLPLRGRRGRRRRVLPARPAGGEGR